MVSIDRSPRNHRYQQQKREQRTERERGGGGRRVSGTRDRGNKGGRKIAGGGRQRKRGESDQKRDWLTDWMNLITRGETDRQIDRNREENKFFFLPGGVYFGDLFDSLVAGSR